MRYDRKDNGEETTLEIEGTLDAVTAPDLRAVVDQLVAPRSYIPAILHEHRAISSLLKFDRIEAVLTVRYARWRSITPIVHPHENAGIGS